MIKVKVKKKCVAIFAFVFVFSLICSSQTEEKKTKKIYVMPHISTQKIFEKEVPRDSINIDCLRFDLNNKLQIHLGNPIEFKYDLKDEGIEFQRQDHDEITVQFTLTNVEYPDGYKFLNFITLQVWKDKETIQVPVCEFYGTKFIITKEVQEAFESAGHNKKIQKIESTQKRVYRHYTAKEPSITSYRETHNISEYKIIWLLDNMSYMFLDENDQYVLTTKLDESVVSPTIKSNNKSPKNGINSAKIKDDNNENNTSKKIKIGLFVCAAIIFGGYVQWKFREFVIYYALKLYKKFSQRS